MVWVTVANPTDLKKSADRNDFPISSVVRRRMPRVRMPVRNLLRSDSPRPSPRSAGATASCTM